MPDNVHLQWNLTFIIHCIFFRFLRSSKIIRKIYTSCRWKEAKLRLTRNCKSNRTTDFHRLSRNSVSPCDTMTYSRHFTETKTNVRDNYCINQIISSSTNIVLINCSMHSHILIPNQAINWNSIIYCSIF